MYPKEKNALHQVQAVDFFSLSEIYHENTKYDRQVSIPDFIKISALRRDPKVWYTLSQSFKNYPGVARIKLPANEMVAPISFEEIIRKRRSARAFSSVTLTQCQLGQILRQTYGITGQFAYDFDPALIQNLRAAPSGGALYPLEIYLFVSNLEAIPPGLYHYNVLEHSLELLAEKDFAADLPAWFCDQESLTNAAAILVFTGVFERTKIKYGERGYRFVLFEAGHAAQNVYLSATAYGVGCVALGGFYEREIEAVMQIDGVKESVLYGIALGSI